jgi:alpha-galactosidase
MFQLSKATQQTLNILKNHEIIAINQDPVVGKAITPFRWGINVGFSFMTSLPRKPFLPA